jgi:hypothetical protein
MKTPILVLLLTVAAANAAEPTVTEVRMPGGISVIKITAAGWLYADRMRDDPCSTMVRANLFHAIAGRVRPVPNEHDDPDIDKCWSWKDDFNKTIGNHALKFGGLYARYTKDEDMFYDSVSPSFWGPVAGGAGLGALIYHANPLAGALIGGSSRKPRLKTRAPPIFSSWCDRVLFQQECHDNG